MSQGVKNSISAYRHGNKVRATFLRHFVITRLSKLAQGIYRIVHATIMANIAALRCNFARIRERYFPRLQFRRRPQRCCAAWRVTPSRVSISAQE